MQYNCWENGHLNKVADANKSMQNRGLVCRKKIIGYLLRGFATTKKAIWFHLHDNHVTLSFEVVL